MASIKQSDKEPEKWCKTGKEKPHIVERRRLRFLEGSESSESISSAFSFTFEDAEDIIRSGEAFKSLTSASRVGVRYIESFLLLGSSDLRGLPEFGKNCAVCSAFVLTGQVYLLRVQATIKQSCLLRSEYRFEPSAVTLSFDTLIDVAVIKFKSVFSVIKPSVHEVREVIKQCLCHVAS